MTGFHTGPAPAQRASSTACRRSGWKGRLARKTKDWTPNDRAEEEGVAHASTWMDRSVDADMGMDDADVDDTDTSVCSGGGPGERRDLDG